jgi:hypothetical protein
MPGRCLPRLLACQAMWPCPHAHRPRTWDPETDFECIRGQVSERKLLSMETEMKGSDVHFVDALGSVVLVLCGRTGGVSLREWGKAERGRLIASTHPAHVAQICAEHQVARGKKYGSALPKQPPDLFPMWGVQVWTARDHDRPIVFRERMPHHKLHSSFGAAGESFVLGIGTTPPQPSPALRVGPRAKIDSGDVDVRARLSRSQPDVPTELWQVPWRASHLVKSSQSVATSCSPVVVVVHRLQSKLHLLPENLWRDGVKYLAKT